MGSNRDLLKSLTPEKRALLAKKLAEKKADQKKQDTTEEIIQSDMENRYEPFPLTELQQAYWIGRSGIYELGDVAGHSYIELENAFDLDRLNKAWQQLIQRHDMLRAVISADGMQQVLKTVPTYEIRLHDLSGLSADEQDRDLLSLRERISHQVLDASQWPLFNFEAAKLSNDKIRLFLGLDALVVDGWSLAILFKEWNILYKNLNEKLPQLELTFRDYVLAEKKLTVSQNYIRAEKYWKSRLDKLPPGPVLPTKTSSTEINQKFFRRHGFLDHTSYTKLKSFAKQYGITHTAVLMAAYCHVISLWSNSTEFTISIPQFNRMPLHPEVNRIVGEAASFSLLEVKLEASDSFIESTRKIQSQLWNDLDNNYFSGVKVLRELTQLHKDATSVLMPVIFTGSPQDQEGNDGYLTTVAADLGDVVYAIGQTPQVWLDNHISEQNGGLSVDWDTVEQLFPDGMQDDMFSSYMQLLSRLSEHESDWTLKRAAMAASLMPEGQSESRAAINSKKRDVPDILVQDLFAAMVQQFPENPAVITTGKTLTYQNLFTLSNQWAHRLQEFKIKKNTLIAIVMEKGWEQPVAAHAALQSGAAYAPMDADQPQDRLNILLKDSQASIVLTQSWLVERFDWPDDINIVCIDNFDVSDYSSESPERTQTAKDLAYVLYTSGSTGNPKGVMITHRGVVNALLCTVDKFSIGPDDKVFALTALHHDLSIFDVFGITAAGGAMVIPDAGNRRDPDHWSRLMNDHQVTIWNSVPAMMDMMLEYSLQHPGCLPASLRWAFLGGDWIPITLPSRLRSQVDTARVVSTGGPTETTLWNIWFPVEEVPDYWSSIPYGRPIENTEYHVLNQDLENCPDWVTGELYCSAIGLAKGYWQDEEKTNEKFFYHPRTGQRMYRTGDLGRFVPAGYIEFAGRTDFQVKIQGQRIETGEIEAALQRHEDIRSAVVTVQGERSQKKKLIAYLVVSPNITLTADDIREYLTFRLPDYMLPSAYVMLDEMPLTANGKVDRRLLPKYIELQSVSSDAEFTDHSHVVSKLAEITQDILGIKSIDPDVNLLSLGANSIDMVRIGNRLESEFGFRPRMDEIFKLQTLNAIGKYCEHNLDSSTSEKDNIGEVDGISSELKKIIASYGTLRDPDKREEFKNAQPGIRNDNDVVVVSLEKPKDSELVDLYMDRYSHRRFGLQPVPFAQFSELLRCLYQLQIDGKPRYLYPSPGGLYATQVYIHIKPGRVESIPAGTYYYHPVKHQLVLHTANVDLKRGFQVPFVNTPVYDEAAFSIFLVTDLSAVAPSYGELSVFFGKLEAGVMAQLIESTGIKSGLAICQIGGANFDKIRDLFDLHEGHFFIHSLLGGPILDKESGYKVNSVVAAETPFVRAKNLIERIHALSDDQARIMLDETLNSFTQGEV